MAITSFEMSEEERSAILTELLTVYTADELDSAADYVSWGKRSDNITLDGTYSAKQLIALAFHMMEHGPKEVENGNTDNENAADR